MRIALTDWEFEKGRMPKAWMANRDSGNTENITIPHCWNLHDTFQYDVNYYRGWGSYRCSFEYTPDVNRPHARLTSNGFYGTGEVWLDGQRIARFDAQYLGLQINLPELAAGTHVLAIRLTNRCAKTVLPGIKMPDFLLYGGLACNALCIEQRSESYLVADTLRVIPASATSYIVAGNVQCFNHIANRSPLIQITIEDTEVDVIAPLSESGFEQLIEVTNPTFWSVDHPHRYQLRVQLKWDGGSDECHRRSIGFRTAEFTADKGFLLNGQSVFLHGCNRHEAMPGFGNALNPDQHREDAKLLKEAGANLVRLSHYPQHPDFLDACDELGICVYAEIATWKSVRGGKWLDNAKRQMRDMILRDGHHPSIILWGLGNETRKRQPYLALQSIVRSLDPIRKTIYAENHIYRGRREQTLDLTDLLGVNYEMDHLAEAIDVSKEGCVLVSECSSHPTERGNLEAEIAQIEKLDAAIKKMRPHAGVAGFTMWCFADYATLRKKRYKRFSGIVDAWRQPKPAYDYFRAHFADEPSLALHGDWSESGPDARTIHLFTNQPNGDVKLNGEVVYQWDNLDPHHSFEIAFQNKPLVACAGDIKACLQPWGTAVMIQVRLLRDRLLAFEAVDVHGHRVRSCNEDLKLPAAYDALVTYRPDQKIEIRAGWAVGYLRPGQPVPDLKHITLS